MTRSATALLASLIDYAGTFPPAKLGLAEAMATYARHRAGIHGWMIGRFVLTFTALDEFETLAPALLGATAPPCHLSVVGTQESLADDDRLARFNRKWKDRAAIVSVEYAPMRPSDIGRVARPLRSDTFFEVPPGVDSTEALAQIALCGGAAKIRTGGVTPDAFPDAVGVVGFMQACHDAKIGLKATAGLHHAMGGRFPLTYEADSARADMFGFLNVAVAAALVHGGASPADALSALRDRSADAFAFSDEGLIWRERMLTTSFLGDSRRHFFKSFGSCSFAEPVEELVRLGIVAEGGIQDAPTPRSRD